MRRPVWTCGVAAPKMVRAGAAGAVVGIARNRAQEARKFPSSDSHFFCLRKKCESLEKNPRLLRRFAYLLILNGIGLPFPIGRYFPVPHFKCGTGEYGRGGRTDGGLPPHGLFQGFYPFVGGHDRLDGAVGIEFHPVDAHFPVYARLVFQVVLVDAVVHDVPFVFARHL